MKIKSLAFFFSTALVLTVTPLLATEPTGASVVMDRAVLEPYPVEPGEGGGEGGGGIVPSNVMDVADFQNMAFTQSQRCLDRPITPAQCQLRLDHALNNGMITRRAYDWAIANGYYPVIDFFDNTIAAICKCGCFDPDTRISARLNGVVLEVAAGDITQQHQLLALESDATRQALHQDYRDINVITKGPEQTPLYRFVLSNGKQLAVTQHHGMVLNDGRVIAAKDVTTTDQFIAANGDVVAIDAIDRVSIDTDVVNFETHGDSDLNHIIVAEGVLVGDLVWQNQRAADLGRVTIRQ